MHESPTTSPRIIERGKLLSVKTYLSPIDETLWAQLEQAQDTLAALDAIYRPPPPSRSLVPSDGSLAPRPELVLSVFFELDREHACRDPEACVILKNCAEALYLARDCIERRAVRRRAFLENIQLFWRLIHQIDEDVLLLLPVPNLAARAIDVQDIVQRNMTTDARKAWVGSDGQPGPLIKAVNKTLDYPASEKPVPAGDAAATTSPYRELARERHIIRQALHAVNERSDRHFRQLAFNTSIRVASAVILLVLGIAAGLVYQVLSRRSGFPDPRDFGTQWVLLLMGAMGALTSNMLTRSLLLATTGPTRRYILYNLFMRPVLGAVAACVFVALALSGLLFQIEPLGPQPPTNHDTAAAVLTPSATANQPPAKDHQALVTIHLRGPEQAAFAYFVFAFVFGFWADRALSKTLDQALQRLFTTAEKTIPAGRLEEEESTA